jgi:methyltransferase (TIGR00027 family)
VPVHPASKTVGSTLSSTRQGALMNEMAPSQTAQSTSLMRALHTRCDPHPIFRDPWGDRLVPATTLDQIRNRALASMDEAARAVALASTAVVDDFVRSSAAYATAITRSRYTEDALRVAASSGLRQYVLIGAGFDSFCLRRDDLAIDVEVYEIDHPATQALKLRRLMECAISVPRSVYFIAADLSKEDLASALSRSTFRLGDPSFFSWLGVSMYLTNEANLASLRAIGQCGGPGSELVFSYLDDRVFRSDIAPELESESFVKLWKRVAAAGEPFLSGFDPTTLSEVLRGVGFLLLEDCDDVQLVTRYDAQGLNGLRPLAPSRVAHARVVGP